MNFGTIVSSSGKDGVTIASRSWIETGIMWNAVEDRGSPDHSDARSPALVCVAAVAAPEDQLECVELESCFDRRRR